MTTPKPRNGYLGWLLVATICGGASGGATWIRKPSQHNPAITTTDWHTICRNVDNLQRDVTKLTADVGRILDRLPPQPPQKLP